MNNIHQNIRINKEDWKMLYVFATIDNGIPKTDRILDCIPIKNEIKEDNKKELWLIESDCFFISSKSLNNFLICSGLSFFWSDSLTVFTNSSGKMFGSNSRLVFF